MDKRPFRIAPYFRWVIYISVVIIAACLITAYRLALPSFAGVMGQSPTTWRGQTVLPVHIPTTQASEPNPTANAKSNKLREGDLILAINGQSALSLTQTLRSVWFGWLGQAEPIAPVVANPIALQIYRGNVLLTLVLTPQTLGVTFLWQEFWGRLIVTLLMLLLSVFIFAKQPKLDAARATLWLGSHWFVTDLLNAVGTAARISEVLHPVAFWWVILFTGYAAIAQAMGLAYLGLAFPETQLTPTQHKRLRQVACIAIAAVMLNTVLPTLINPNNGIGQTMATARFTASIVWVGILIFFIAQLVRAYRAARTPLTQQKIRVVCLMWSLTALVYVALARVPILLGYSPQLPHLLMLAFPLSLAYALHKQQLFGVDLLINRVLVYGALSALLVGGYVGLVSVATNALSKQTLITQSQIAPITAALLVAIAFEPLRRKLQTVVNHLMYGYVFEPHRVMNQLNKTVTNASQTDVILTDMATVIAQSLRLPHVAVLVWRDGILVTVAEYGQPTPGLAFHRTPLLHQGIVLGELALIARAKGDAFTRSEIRLVQELAQPVGMAAFAWQTHHDLRQTRHRLADTREEERRKVQRDLHDGLGQPLGGLLLMLGVALKQIKQEPEATQTIEPLLADLQTMTTDIIGELRQMINQLRPPMLEQFGFAAALHQLVHQTERAAAQSPLSIHLQLPEPQMLADFQKSIEVAAYRIMQEALNNVVKHAHATRVDIQIVRNQSPAELHIIIADNGVGLCDTTQHNPASGCGVGLHSMRERAEELGGWFRVVPAVLGGVQVEVGLPYTP